jgi:kinetochore protein Nuf2
MRAKQRAQYQLANAQDKYERAQRDLDERRSTGQQTIERLQREYEAMASQRKDNDKQVEELRRQANEVERKVHSPRAGVVPSPLC